MAYDIITGRNQADKKTFGDKGLIHIGKGYVKMGQYTSLSSKIFMDVARSHVILVSGKRGSGKSYTLGVIAEELSNLPKEFHGLKIGQLSDIHSGSFWNKTAVKGGVEMFLNEKPDIVFFTGDNGGQDRFKSKTHPRGFYLNNSMKRRRY